MSIFLGFIEEIPGISVDCFDEENMNSSAYFLSHCHSDHMRGLDDAFFDHLKQYNKYLYCSHISKVFLENRHYRNLRNVETYVKDIAIDEKVCVEYKKNNDSEETDILFVKSTSAGHCPGSVMFIFEKMDKLILYTGDFRINPRDYSKIRSLHYCKDFNVFPKKFDKVYLDTTFLDHNFTYFPTRKESINVMCKVVKEWLDKSPRKVVILECSALYGSEFLYMELSKSLKTLIHVRESVYNSYSRIPELACHITNNPLDARIHACTNKWNSSDLVCTHVLKEDKLIIVPSAQKWKGLDTSVVGEWDKIKEKTFNVCYSTHASFDELKKFIQYFKPKEIYPCVCPKNVKDTVLRQLLDEIKR